MIRTRLLSLALAATLLAPMASAQGDAESARRAQGISGRVMSPFCPGKTIQACPSPKAAEWRNDIRQWAAEGVSNEEIERRLQERVPGFDIAGTPPSPLGGWLPLILGLGAVGVLVFVLRRATRAGRGAASSSPSPIDEAAEKPSAPASAGDAALDRRIDEELDEL